MNLDSPLKRRVVMRLSKTLSQMEYWREIILSTTWLYDGSVPVQAYVVKQNFDPYYEEDYDPDLPVVNEDGESYSLVFGELRAGGWFWSERPPFLTRAGVLRKAKEDFGLTEWEDVKPPQRIQQSPA